MNVFDNIIVWAPSILYFKGLGMRNLQYQIRICQKSHNTVTIHNYILRVVRIFMNQTLYCCQAVRQKVILELKWY